MPEIMLLATSSEGKSYFWTGLLLGSVVTAVGMTWLNYDGRREAREAQQSRSAKSTPRSGRFSLMRSSRKGIREIMKDPSFLSDIMEQLWPYMKVAGAESIRESVEPSFADLSAPLKSCKFTKLDLGDVPMRMDNIVVHPLQPDGSVQFDIDIDWDGDCDFRLKSSIGTFGIKSLKLHGRMAIILKPLTNELPVVSGIQYSFINMPKISLSFTGLAAVAELSVLETTVQNALEASLITSVLPYRSLYKMDVNNNFLDTYTPPVGVLRLSLEGGKGFVIEKRLLAKDDIPDVYLNVTLGADPQIIKTKTIKDNLNPVWNQQGDFCLFDKEQHLKIHAWDEDNGPMDADDDLGVALIPVAEVLTSPQQRSTLPLLLTHKDGSEEDTGATVTVSAQVCEWTTDLKSLTKQTGNVSNEICGLLVVIINRAYDIPLDKKTACTFVKVTYAGQEHDSTMIYDYPGWDSLNPIYDTGITIPISTTMPRGDNAKIQLELIQMENEKCTVLGKNTVSFKDLKTLPNNTRTETHKMGDKGASLQYRISLSGVAPPKANTSSHSSALAPGSSSPTKGMPLRGSPRLKDTSASRRLNVEDPTPLGTFQLTVVQASGLKVQEALFGFEVPDVLCQVKFDGDIFETSVKHNQRTPVWNESHKWELHDHGQLVNIKAFDRNDIAKEPDVFIGSAKVTIGKLLLAGGTVDVELKNKEGRPNGVTITVSADML